MSGLFRNDVMVAFAVMTAVTVAVRLGGYWLMGYVTMTPRVRREPPRQGEIQRNYSLIEKARATLGYAPQVPLEDGLRRTWDWFAST